MSASGQEHTYSFRTGRRVSSIPIPSVHRGGGGGAPNEIVVTDSDVLSGRGHAVASHPGCIRFRKLVSSHTDDNYCSGYETIEKRAVADQIIAHIQSLNPPGRFLRKSKHRTWEEMTYDDSLKKTVQALRDANREDRTGYAEAVAAPDDVQQHRAKIEKQGLTKRQFAKKAAVDFVARIRDIPQASQGTTQTGRLTVNPTPSAYPSLAIGSAPSERQGLTTRGYAKRAAAEFVTPAHTGVFQPGSQASDPTTSLPSSPPDIGSIASSQWTNSSPEFAAAASASHGALPSVTPSTVARPAQALQALFEDDRKPAARESFYHPSGALAPSPTADVNIHGGFEDSPRLDDSGEGFVNTYDHPTSGPSSNDALDVMAARAAAGLDNHGTAALSRHSHDHPHDYPANIFHDVDDDMQISAAHAFEDPKY